MRGEQMKQKNFEKNLFSANDISPAHCGFEECKRGHSFGPFIRDHHLIHFVTNGHGRFFIGNREYNLSAGELFYIPPKVVTFYRADTANPWSYSWIGMRGIAVPTYLKNAGLSEKNPVMRFSQQALSVLNEIISISEEITAAGSPRMIGLLYFLIDELIRCGGKYEKYKSSSQLYAETAVRYINDNIHKKLSVAKLAEFVGIDRSYLCAVFKNLLGYSPQQYIIDAKVSAAKSFLTETQYEIKYIAASLGYDDQFVFSHAFKARTGMSPRAWRSAHSK